MSEQDNNTNQNAVAIRQSSEIEEIGLPVEQVLAQVHRIQEIQRAVMREGEHYGKIPGCGDKPTLLKPGAEKLGFTFRLAPRFETQVRDFQGGHREYEVVCRLYTIGGERLVGEGVGSCSTMEAKYRYRTEYTDNPVPQEYWKSRDPKLLGGHDFQPRKVNGKWIIVHRVDHDNPADYYNTCLKMAKKRAHVDAILTATAASDIFTQDVEDLPEVEMSTEVVRPIDKPITAVKPPQQKAQVPVPATEPQHQNGNGHKDIPNDALRMLDAVTVKPGKKKNGEPFTRYSVRIGNDWYSTFDTEYGKEAERAYNKKLPVILEWKQEGEFKNIINLQVYEQQVPAEDKPKEEVPF